MSELVSIVIPIYNSEQFLKESLESIINQTYSNIEIICVNDGSTDNSLEILKSYSDKITIISQKNEGLASALNAGIKEIQGKWFKWFSPDDLMYPSTISSLVKEYDKLDKNTIIYSNWEIIDFDGKHIRYFDESNYNKLSNFNYNIRLLDGQQINVNTALIPSKIFEKNIIFKDLDDPVAIDYDFFLRCGILYKIKFHLIPKPLMQYRIHFNQLSRKNISKTLKYTEKIKFQILSSISEEEKIKYLVELKKYQKSKIVKQKIMQLGLKLLLNGPTQISDIILNLYLSKIRRSR
jgi:glycosyltransferase involved in cell wall biosynthesis